MKITTRILVACLPGIVAGALFAASTGERTDGKTNANDTALSKAKASMAKMPLSFEPNRGQTDPRVQFLSRGPGYTVFFTKDETVMSLKDTKTSNAVVRMRFIGGTNSASAHPYEALPNYSNYIVGNDSSKWVSDVKEYSKLRYENVYPGIDVIYQGDQQQLRYDFVVKPGASATAIQMAFEGADKIAVTKDGDLALTIGGKTLVTRKPLTYQEVAGVKTEVASHYVVKDGRVTFELAKYDTAKDVVIDPTVLFITYLGGLLNDSVNGVAIVNPSQSISSQPSFYYVAGTTASANFPGTSGEFQPALTGANDVFVSKISFNGATLVWSTYLGGNSQDTGNAIAVDIVSPAGNAGTSGGTAGCTASGCAVVVGQTFSTNFPTFPFVTTNPLSGTNDAFVTKLSQDGKSLLMSSYLGGVTNDQATGVAVNNGTVAPNGTFSCTGSPQPAGCADIYIGGYTDSPFFLCPANNPNASFCTNANHTLSTSSDAFVIRIPIGAYSSSTPFINPNGGLVTASGVLSTLYGGFGEEFAHGLAFNPTNKMVYVAGDTTTGSQNFVTPNAVNLPGITNQTAITGLPGLGTQARGGFVVAFDSTTLIRTFASYVAVSPAGSTGAESIEGVAAEGGLPAVACTGQGGTCTPTSSPSSALISPTYGNFGHIYITGVTTSNVPTSSIAIVVPGNACASGLNATDGSITGSKTGVTSPSGCTTALVTQAPFNQNFAVNSGCVYPPVVGPFGGQPPTPTCNLAAYVAILDAALDIQQGVLPVGVGNQIEYWAYYSSVAVAGGPGTGGSTIGGGTGATFFTYAAGNSSAVANAIAIDTNPTTNNTVYSLGTYQQMYITGNTTQTVNTGGNRLPTTFTPFSNTNPQEIFTSYNVGTTGGGGVGGLNPNGQIGTVAAPFPTAAFIARFNPNGLAAQAYGGAANFGNGSNPLTNVIDRSPILNTPQFNYGEFLYNAAVTSTSGTSGNAITNTTGNAIAVDPTRAVLIGGATNNTQAGATGACTTSNGSCQFTTTNTLPAAPGVQNNGGTDGWVSVLFFNDILTDAPSVSSANPFLEPGAPQNMNPGVNGASITYLETTPPPFGPTFDFALSDMTTQTQTFQVIFTGQTSGQILQQTPFFIPKDSRSGYGTTATINNGLPGSAVVYYLPCFGPGGNPYPAPGGPYNPGTCLIPGLYPTPAQNGIIPTSASGWPSANPAFGSAAVSPTPIPGQGWLIVSQDVSPGVVRLQLDRRAAAGLLEGTYVAQFLVSTYDSQTPTQWPPCGPISVLNPFVSGAMCTNPGTPIPADNHSILVTVRLVVRPSLFLSRNAGFLTGITSNLQQNPLSGPLASLITQQGTSKVPDWYANDGSATQVLTGDNGVNSGPAVCTPGLVAGQNFGWTPNLNPQTGAGTVGSPAFTGAGVTVPCPILLPLAPNPVTGLGTVGSGALYGATAYALNGPGDLSGGSPVYTNAGFLSVPTAATPNMTFLYDAGTVQSPSIAAQEGLVTTRPDCPLTGPIVCPTFNSDFQGGIDPATQRNDATVHDYYVTAEGAATLSVEAINCTNMSNPSVGNWLAVSVGGSSTYTPICTNHTASTVGTSRAPVTACFTGATSPCTYIGGAFTGITDDSGIGFAGAGELITLDFLTKAFTNRTGANGIPTGLYTANVYVWSTRAKNSIPGYCLGASMPASGSGGADPTPLCGPTSSSNGATDGNPNPEILVQQQQMFTVTLFVFDTTQIIQITPNSCPTNGFLTSTPVTQFVTVANSENIDTGNPLNGFGIPTGATYPQFGPNASGLVAFSLLPFQTTGAAITIPCPANNSASCVPPLTGQNFTVPLPAGVTVTAQTPAQYNACNLPTGFAGTTAITGASVPGVGTLQLTGPQSQTVFVPAANGTNTNVTIYACRPTVAPAWLNSSLYPGNSLSAFSGAPEPYSSGNGPVSAAAPSTALQTCALNTCVVNCGGGGGNPATNTEVGVFRGGNSYLEDSNGNRQFDVTDTNLTTFIPPGGFKAGDLPVTGDWNGNGHSKVGVYRPSTGTWFLDTNGSGVFDSGDSTFQFGGLAGDIPVTGDWTLQNKSCIGIYRSNGGVWLLDLNCNGTFDGGTTDAFIPFGGLTNDVPVTGNWGGPGTPTRVGLVRAFAPGGIVGACNSATAVGCPFFWVFDSANPNAGSAASAHPPAAGAYAYGGLFGDVFVTGDWLATGTARGGVYRGGIWLLDEGLNGTNNHTYDTFFGYGGLSSDIPITGKW
jgi:hypothetical protein